MHAFLAVPGFRLPQVQLLHLPRSATSAKVPPRPDIGPYLAGPVLRRQEGRSPGSLAARRPGNSIYDNPRQGRTPRCRGLPCSLESRHPQVKTLVASWSPAVLDIPERKGNPRLRRTVRSVFPPRRRRVRRRVSVMAARSVSVAPGPARFPAAPWCWQAAVTRYLPSVAGQAIIGHTRFAHRPANLLTPAGTVQRAGNAAAPADHHRAGLRHRSRRRSPDPVEGLLPDHAAARRPGHLRAQLFRAHRQPGEPAGQPQGALLDRRHPRRRRWAVAGPAERHQGSWWEAWSEWITARAGERQPPPGNLGSGRHPVLCPAPGLYVRDMMLT
jgi:hypothetical protein